jgi:hypothetical protein
MARFYGGVEGYRDKVTRIGSKDSGLRVFAQGWRIGARVRCFVGDDDVDQMSVTLYGGTLNMVKDLCLGRWKNVNGVIVPLVYEKPDILFGTWRITNGSLVLEAA